MREVGLAPTQKLANDLIAAAFHGMLVRSFVHGATGDDLNLVVWTWGPTSARLVLIDEEGRLAPRA